MSGERELGMALCDQLGLDPNVVTGIDISIDLVEVTVSVRLAVDAADPREMSALFRMATFDRVTE